MKIAEQPLMDYSLAMSSILPIGDIKAAKAYSDMVEQLITEHSKKVEALND